MRFLKVLIGNKLSAASNNTKSRSVDAFKSIPVLNLLDKKANPKYYSNDNNLLPHPLVLELLHMIYKRYGQNGIFVLYTVLDLITNLILHHIYRITFSDKNQYNSELALFLIVFNPLSIISVWVLNTNIFMYFMIGKQNELFKWQFI